MNMREMHYDFKQKLNKIDSQKNRNLQVPEIDWKLNEAQEIFVKVIAQPRLRSQLGFEINQRTIDDIRTIVLNQTPANNNCIQTFNFGDDSFLAQIPEDYWFFVGGKVYATKDSCVNVRLSIRPVTHDDEHDVSVFDRSSFEWRIANIRFNKDGIKIFTDGTFDINLLCLNYIKKPVRIHNAQDFHNGQYEWPDGTLLSGTQACELPEPVHGEIVDLAVLLTSIDINSPDTQQKQNKVQLTN